MRDSLRLAFGTLTRLPVPAPTRINPHVAGRAMSLAPVVAVVLAIPLLVTIHLLDRIGSAGSLHALLVATLAIALLAYLTRALHLDGLADTADALGSGRPAAQALGIARKSDIGPFGVIALVLALALQVISLAKCIDVGYGLTAITWALIVSRTALVWACTRLMPAARSDGLGAAVATSVPVWIAIMWAVALGTTFAYAPRLAIALVVGALATLIALTIARRRLGGVTGDVLGAVVEVAFTVVLVSLAFLN